MKQSEIREAEELLQRFRSFTPEEQQLALAYLYGMKMQKELSQMEAATNAEM